MSKTEIHAPVGQLFQAEKVTVQVNLAKLSDITSMVLCVGSVQITFKKTYRTPKL